MPVFGLYEVAQPALPAGPYTMAANGDVSRVGEAGGTVAVPVIGKVTGVTVLARQIVTADITATVADALAAAGPGARLCVLPEGPQTIPYVETRR